MERQKIFWVVLSVSVFVVVVLVVGVFLLSQRPPSAVAAAPGTISPIADSGTQIYEYQREAPSAQSGSGQAGGASPTASSGQKPGQSETMHFYIGEGGETPTTGQGTSTATPTPSAVAQPAAPAASSQPGATAKTVGPAPKKTLPATPPAPAKPPQRLVDYWIQTGSYKGQTKAEELAALLGGKGLTARVFSYSSKNETYFRVRIGPYANRAEAEKFLSIIKKVQGLESSYISQVAATKSVN